MSCGRLRLLLLVATAFVVVRHAAEAIRVEHVAEIHKDATSITIEWRVTPPPPPSTMSSSEIVDWIGFKIKYFTEKLQYAPILLKNPELRKFRLDNLKSNSEYRIQVSAYSSKETEGPASELLVVRTAEAVPGEPQDFKVVRVTSTSIDLEWKAPKRDDQLGSSNSIKGYEIHYFKVNQPVGSPSGSSLSSSLSSSSLSSSSDHLADGMSQSSQILKRRTGDLKRLKYTLSELEPNSLYKIQIFAYNRRGDGQRSPPLLVRTLDEGLTRPQNIRSEIRNDDVLLIRWEAPTSTSAWSSTGPAIDGYLVHFLGEKFELDAHARQITFHRPKWDYDRQYEFKIAAKSGALYGQEAIYHISTHTNQSKIVIHLEKLTSRSVLVRWNPVHFSASSSNAAQPARVSYKLEYWPKSDPDRVITHERLNTTELQLANLTPATDYLVQVAAFSTPLSSAVSAAASSDASVKHFRTLANDLDAPQGMQVVRFEPDKISLNWQAAPPSAGIKAYRIYFKELGSDDEGDESVSTSLYDIESSDEWRAIEQPSDRITETILEDLNVNRDYAIKLTAVDKANNEGPETQVQVAYRLSSSSSSSSSNSQIYAPSGGVDVVGGGGSGGSGGGQVSDRIGAPQDVEVIEYTATSVKFAWMPPAPPSTIRSFIISHVARSKVYRETNGSLVTIPSGNLMSIKVPARDDPTIKIKWLVTGLSPYTDYDFNISSVGSGDLLLSHPVHRHVKTRPARPASVEAPQITQILDHKVLMRLGNASARNGPITKYWLVIVPIDPLLQHHHQQQQQQQQLHIKSAQSHPDLSDLNGLVRYSLFNTSASNESAYITAEFNSEYWPREYTVGVGESLRYGRFVNRKLSSNVEYKAFTIAFSQDTPTTTTMTTTSSGHQPNMLLLADVVQQHQQQQQLSSQTQQLVLESDLFTPSSYSKVFSTRAHLDMRTDRISAPASSSPGTVDLYNILWVVGAVIAFIIIVVMIILLSISYMQKKSKMNQAAAAVANQQQHQQQRLLMNGHGGGAGGAANTLMRQQQQHNGVIVTANGNISATSSTSTTANLVGSGRSMETHINKNGHIQTTLMRGSGSTEKATVTTKSASQMFELTQPASASTNSAAAAAAIAAIISSSSSSSSTTASPTTALLSCSVNNRHHNHHHNHNMHHPHPNGSQSSGGSNTHTTNTNNTATGLLTTASPLKSNSPPPPPPPPPPPAQIMQESLYTSIEVTQKLLQQQLNGNGGIGAQYDNTLGGGSMNMMMLMHGGAAATLNTTNSSIHNPNNTTNANSTFSAIGTMNRTTNRLMGSSSSGGQHQAPPPQFSLPPHYDPIEYRRIHYATAALAAHPPIGVDDLFQHIDRLKAHGNAVFSHEYESIEPGQQFTWDTALSDCNRLKNRYANVIAYDHSRVILSRLDDDDMGGSGGADRTGAEHHSDYINASFCDGYRKPAAYIATQGPLPATYGDFWRMIWEQGSSTIVMMTRLEERQRLKCDQYWPNKGTEVYDNCMQVTLVDHTELAAYSIRTFVVAPVNSYAQQQISANAANMNFEMRREVKHFQYTAWPDHGVPDHPTQFLMFVRRVRTVNPPDAGPITVHCSAGVGRTGCFIVVDTMLERLRAGEKTVDIYGHVTCLRSQRNFMIQTEDQYIFCYDAVLEASQSGPTDVPARLLYTQLQKLLQPATVNGCMMNGDIMDAAQHLQQQSPPLTEMELEYKRLSNAKAPQSKFHAANLPANKFKNRLVNILPYEATRVVLTCLPNQPESAGTDYINANFIDGYRYKRAYIATQAPLQETIDDFWRMLWEHDSTIVVMLTKLREMGREKCAQYWPTERSIRYQYFVVDPVNVYNMNSIIMREFKVTDARDGQSRQVRQFQLLDWPEQGVPKSGESIIELIGQVHKWKEGFGQTGPITVHCSAGVGRTGVFITLSIALERLRYEDHVDIYNTVKLLRTQRPAMVQTEDQYQFCYRAILEYLGTFE